MAKRRGGRRPRWATARRWSEELAREALAAFFESGETLREFAERQGVSAQRLDRWRRRLEVVDQAPAFIEVTPQRVEGGGERRADVFEVIVSSGRVVRVPASFDEGALRRLLAVVEDRPC